MLRPMVLPSGHQGLWAAGLRHLYLRRCRWPLRRPRVHNRRLSYRRPRCILQAFLRQVAIHLRRFSHRHLQPRGLHISFLLFISLTTHHLLPLPSTLPIPPPTNANFLTTETKKLQLLSLMARRCSACPKHSNSFWKTLLEAFTPSTPSWSDWESNPSFAMLSKFESWEEWEPFSPASTGANCFALNTSISFTRTALLPGMCVLGLSNRSTF